RASSGSRGEPSHVDMRFHGATRSTGMIADGPPPAAGSELVWRRAADAIERRPVVAAGDAERRRRSGAESKSVVATRPGTGSWSHAIGLNRESRPSPGFPGDLSRRDNPN